MGAGRQRPRSLLPQLKKVSGMQADGVRLQYCEHSGGEDI